MKMELEESNHDLEETHCKELRQSDVMNVIKRMVEMIQV